MSEFVGVVRYEYRMSLGRRAVWIALVLLFLYWGSVFLRPGDDLKEFIAGSVWQVAGHLAFAMNLFMPVVAGIAAADRLVRDSKLGVEELLHSLPAGRWPYVLGKYAGVLLSLLTPVFLCHLAVSIVTLAYGAPAGVVPASVVAFLGIIVPAYAFVTAFSLAGPLVMPGPIYQVLFTGYWFWGNFLNPDIFPTLSGTLLTPGGRYVLEGFFSAGLTNMGEATYTAGEATLNLLVLGSCIALVLVALERFLAWQAQRA